MTIAIRKADWGPCMQPSPREAQALLDNTDEALRTWWDTYLKSPGDEDDLQLTAGGIGIEKIKEVFDRWYGNSRGILQSVLCGKIGYRSLSERAKVYGEITTIGLIAAALSLVAPSLYVDPLSTAVVVFIRHGTDNLCEEETSEPSPESE